MMESSWIGVRPETKAPSTSTSRPPPSASCIAYAPPSCTTYAATGARFGRMMWLPPSLPIVTHGSVTAMVRPESAPDTTVRLSARCPAGRTSSAVAGSALSVTGAVASPAASSSQLTRTSVSPRRTLSPGWSITGCTTR